MSTRNTDSKLYSEAEARICLTCTNKRCIGTCDRLKQEKKRIRAEQKAKPRRTDTNDQRAAAKLPKN